MTEQEIKIKELLDDYNNQIERHETEVAALESRISFCKEHNFGEEVRMAQIKLNAIDIIIYRWRRMHKEISDLYKQSLTDKTQEK